MLNIDPDEAIKKTMAILDAVDEVHDICRSYTDIEGIVFEEAKRFFINEISAAMAAKNMAAAVDLYFKEQ